MAVSFLMFLLMVTASAYTVVMRGGRRIEIPSRFVVTRTTLTYEVVQGIQITLQMAAIDIAATDRANRESPGSLLARAESGSGTLSAPNENAENDAASHVSRTITNRDLEAIKKRRRASEVAYESRRRELGLPSVGMSRKRDASDRELIERDLKQTRGAERETETYWRSRASALRADMAVLDAEINYTRARLDEVSSLDSGGFTTLESDGSFNPFGGQFPGRRPGGWGTRDRGIFDPGPFPQARPVGIGPPYVLFPNAGTYGSPYDSTYERNALVTRFNELGATRAGLSARWRQLEDEARRAGASPGWLRP
jgi:hypothetical protein